jgi:hypothetical protein
VIASDRLWRTRGTDAFATAIAGPMVGVVSLCRVEEIAGGGDRLLRSARRVEQAASGSFEESSSLVVFGEQHDRFPGLERQRDLRQRACFGVTAGDDNFARQARKAANDLLAYRRAFGSLLDDQPEPYGLGLAWGRELEPNSGAEIMLATPDTLASALVSTVR